MKYICLIAIIIAVLLLITIIPKRRYKCSYCGFIIESRAWIDFLRTGDRPKHKCPFCKKYVRFDMQGR